MGVSAEGETMAVDDDDGLGRVAKRGMADIMVDGRCRGTQTRRVFACDNDITSESFLALVLYLSSMVVSIRMQG